MYKEKICKFCNKPFIPKSSTQKYCSEQCAKQVKANRAKENEYKYICNNCQEPIVRVYPKRDDLVFCDSFCKKEYHRKNVYQKVSCITCGNEFIKEHKNQLYCSNKCKRRKNDQDRKLIYTCKNCKKEYFSKYYKSRDSNFCSSECELQYRYKMSHETRVCKFCGIEFECKTGEKLVYCSLDCHNKHQTYLRPYKNLPDGVVLSEALKWTNCRVCGKSFYENSFQNLFYRTPVCSDECLEIFKKTNYKSGFSSTQRRLNSILDLLGISYIQEKKFGKYKLDNYICNNIAIECMGTYWHVDHRKYVIEDCNKTQKDRIFHDNKRHLFMENNQMNILYLWQTEIEKYPNLCMALIELYLKNNGNLLDYHSFNYVFKNNKIYLNNNMEIPYFQRNDILSA